MALKLKLSLRSTHDGVILIQYRIPEETQWGADAKQVNYKGTDAYSAISYI